MEDAEIIRHYFERSERAILETAAKYGTYCAKIAGNILEDRQDCEECVNESYLQLWKHIPPDSPSSLRVYLGRVVHNLCVSRQRERSAKKRGGGARRQPMEELQNSLFSDNMEGEIIDRLVFREVLNDFLAALPKQTRQAFVLRYWYCEPVHRIAESLGLSDSAVKSLLLRIRTALRAKLEKEGVIHASVRTL